MRLFPDIASVRSISCAMLLGGFSFVCEAGALSSAASGHGAPALGRVCAGCHGEKGEGGGSIPSLEGKSGAELMIALRDFRSGKRKGTVMNRIVQGYGDAALADWAHWFGQDSR